MSVCTWSESDGDKQSVGHDNTSVGQLAGCCRVHWMPSWKIGEKNPSTQAMYISHSSENWVSGCGSDSTSMWFLSPSQQRLYLKWVQWWDSQIFSCRCCYCRCHSRSVWTYRVPHLPHQHRISFRLTTQGIYWSLQNGKHLSSPSHPVVFSIIWFEACESYPDPWN